MIVLIRSYFLINLKIALMSFFLQLEDYEDLFEASLVNMKNYRQHHILKIFLYLDFVYSIIEKNYL